MFDVDLAQKYIEQYLIIRDIESSPSYGIGPSHAPKSLQVFHDAVEAMGVTDPVSALDFGCGSMAADFLNALYPGPGVMKYAYDPGVPGLESASDIPRFVDLLFCLDVMEHIPEPNVADTLRGLSHLTDHAIFIVHHWTAKAILPNGENAHVTVKPPEWWLERMREAGFKDARIFKVLSTMGDDKPLRTLIIT